MVSIVIPNFNKANYLEETLNSLLAQTYIHWEALIIDDGSTDQSKEIIEKFAEGDSRFKAFYLEKKQHGGASCRNFGVQKAEGEYLVFFDSDDILLPNCLSHRVEFMVRNPNVDFAVFGMESFVHDIDEKGHKWLPTKEKALERFLAHELPWAIMQPIYRMTFLIENELKWRTDVSRMQDVFYHTQCLFHNPKFEVQPNIIDSKYRVDPLRMISDSKEHYQNWVDAVKIYYQTYSYGFVIQLDQMLIRAQQVLSQAFLKKEINKRTFVMLSADMTQVSENKLITNYSKLITSLPFHVPGIQRFFLGLISFFSK